MEIGGVERFDKIAIQQKVNLYWSGQAYSADSERDGGGGGGIAIGAVQDNAGSVSLLSFCQGRWKEQDKE